MNVPAKYEEVETVSQTAASTTATAAARTADDEYQLVPPRGYKRKATPSAKKQSNTTKRPVMDTGVLTPTVNEAGRIRRPTAKALAIYEDEGGDENENTMNISTD
ncbi:MAG: hypothetical protein HETSPECPRED_003274 [Heterodermia speciosa]|uniref:Uncharacterized protein n=1 Tax=Heterodermia speciosa TaxID=116794 RepID=A0A8H3HVD4_9LECA|nr:MAG: hypothetical protein HETSPECPRED_003274 [Heterodermia speciosa]